MSESCTFQEETNPYYAPERISLYKLIHPDLGHSTFPMNQIKIQVMKKKTKKHNAMITMRIILITFEF